MPMTVNGFGTSICGSRGDVGWGSFDGMEWIVAAYMPLVPIKAVHTFDWNGEEYKCIPIKWSFELACRTFFWRWLWGFVLLAIILGIVSFVGDAGFKPIVFLIAVACVVMALGMWLVLHTTDSRNKNIRLVLGAVTVGNCDPANFNDDLLHDLAGNPQLAYGTKTFAKAVPVLLERGSYAQAMWAARLCVAVENPRRGEELTDEVLAHPDVIDALPRIRENGEKWAKLMLSAEDREAPEPSGRDQDWSERDDARDEKPRRRREEEDDRPRRLRDDDRDDRRSRDDERDDRRSRDDDRPARRREDEDRPRRRKRDDDDY